MVINEVVNGINHVLIGNEQRIKRNKLGMNYKNEA